MQFTGIFFALLTTLSWSIGIFPFTQAARRLGVNALNHFRLMLATLLIGITSLLIAPLEFRQLFTQEFQLAWLWLGLSGIIGLTIGDYFGFGMFAILGPRLGSVLTTFAPAAALLLGFFLLDEHLSWIGIIGVLVTISGVIWISLGKSEREQIPDHGHGSIFKGVIFGILAALCQGAGLVLAKKGMLAERALHLEIHPVHATFIRLLIGTSSLFLLTLVLGKIKEVILPLKINREKGLKFAIAGTIFGPSFGVSLSLYTVSMIDASVAQTIFSLVPVVALLLSFLLHREKITFKSMLGVLVAILGVVILIWRERLKELF